MKKCSHCFRSMNGFAQINDDWLCHPDDEGALDCYTLVLQGHAIPCVPCIYKEKLRGR